MVAVMLFSAGPETHSSVFRSSAFSKLENFDLDFRPERG
jgi:hypothetical protein